MSILSFLSSPVTFAAVAAIALGVVVYELVKNKQEERNYSYHSGKRPRPNSSPSSDQPVVAYYEDTANSVRRRKQSETKAKPCSQTCTKSGDKRKLSEERPPKFDEEDYCQNVCDKIGNDVKNLNKDDDKKTFQKRIDDYPANNTSVNVEEIKVINTQTSKENQGFLQQSTQNVLSNKENICKQETNPTSFDDPCSSQKTVPNDKQNHTETDNPLCMGCQEVLSDAVTYPCKHCYLCINCATIIHRIHKKCCLCDSEIEYFQPIEK